MQRECLRRRGDHGDANTDVGILAEAEGTEREYLAVGLAENLKTRVWQRVGHDADLHADRFLSHQGREVLGLRARKPAARRPRRLVEIMTADKAVAQEARHL